MQVTREAISRPKGGGLIERMNRETKVYSDRTFKTIYDHLKIKGFLGQGGFGEVSKAALTERGQGIVVKKLKEELLDDELIKRFENEAKILELIRDVQDSGLDPRSDYLIKLIGFTKEREDRFGIVLEYAESSLKDIIKETKEKPEVLTGKEHISNGLEYMISVAKALGVMHDMSYVHRDLKPENVMLSKGTPKLIDFGISARFPYEKYFDERLTQTGVIIGSPSHMSPEQIRGHKESIDNRSDIFSIGTTFFEYFTGRLLYTGNNSLAVAHKVAFAETPKMYEENGPVSKALNSIILKSNEKDMNKRHQSVDELIEDIENAKRIIEENPEEFPLTLNKKSTTVLRYNVMAGEGKNSEEYVQSNESVPAIDIPLEDMTVIRAPEQKESYLKSGLKKIILTGMLTASMVTGVLLYQNPELRNEENFKKAVSNVYHNVLNSDNPVCDYVRGFLGYDKRKEEPKELETVIGRQTVQKEQQLPLQIDPEEIKYNQHIKRANELRGEAAKTENPLDKYALLVQEFRELTEASSSKYAKPSKFKNGAERISELKFKIKELKEMTDGTNDKNYYRY